jgi:hypothetical protein
VLQFNKNHIFDGAAKPRYQKYGSLFYGEAVNNLYCFYRNLYLFRFYEEKSVVSSCKALLDRQIDH